MIYNSNLINLFFENLNEDPNIIRGAINSDLNEIKAALVDNPDCINELHHPSGMTALIIAAIDGQYTLVDYLCDQPGIDVSIFDNHGRSAYGVAIALGRYDIDERIMRDNKRAIETIISKDDTQQTNKTSSNLTHFRPKPPF